MSRRRKYRRKPSSPPGFKFCCDCDDHRPVSEFGRDRSKSDGLAIYCRVHMRDRARVYHGWDPSTPFVDRRGGRSRPKALKFWKRDRMCRGCGRALGPARTGILYCGECRVENKRKRWRYKDKKKRDRYFSDPIYRAKVKERRNTYCRQPSNRKREQERHKERMATDQEYRAKVNERKRVRDRLKRATDPEWLQRRRESVQRAKAKRDARKRGVEVESIDRRRVWERDGGICYLCGVAVPFKDYHLEHKIPISRGGGHTMRNVGVSCRPCNLAKADRTPLEFMCRG